MLAVRIFITFVKRFVIMAELKVKEILNQRGISVPEFAEMVGVTREHCHYTLVGKNAMGKILTVLRDNNGVIDYNLEYPLYLFGNEIK